MPILSDHHPEDVKAAIRKRFGSLRNFEKEKGLPDQTVTNLLRGRLSKSGSAAKAVEEFLSTGLASDPSGPCVSADPSEPATDAHRLNDGDA